MGQSRTGHLETAVRHLERRKGGRCGDGGELRGGRVRLAQNGSVGEEERRDDDAVASEGVHRGRRRRVCRRGEGVWEGEGGV